MSMFGTDRKDFMSSPAELSVFWFGFFPKKTTHPHLDLQDLVENMWENTVSYKIFTGTYFVWDCFKQMPHTIPIWGRRLFFGHALNHTLTAKKLFCLECKNFKQASQGYRLHPGLAAPQNPSPHCPDRRHHVRSSHCHEAAPHHRRVPPSSQEWSSCSGWRQGWVFYYWHKVAGTPYKV